MKHQSSLPRTQETTTDPYPEPDLHLQCQLQIGSS
jgi:hypothetical protein